jgi:hypothetical protein
LSDAIAATRQLSFSPSDATPIMFDPDGGGLVNGETRTRFT